MKYTLSFRWVKFALIALVGWMAVSVPLLLVMVWLGHPEFQPFLLIAYIPFAIWYLRSYWRDKKEFEAGTR